MASIAFTSVGKLIELLNEATAGERLCPRAERQPIGAGRRSAPREVLFSCGQTEPAMNEGLRQQSPPAANGSEDARPGPSGH